MINIKANTIEEAVYKTYKSLYKSTAIVSDPQVYKEDSAVIRILNITKPKSYIEIKNNRYIYTFNHKLYIPSVETEKLKEEEVYWTDSLLKTKAKDLIVKHLVNNPNSRRAIFNLWKDDHFNNPSLGAACITQLYFRVKGINLELHTHARANDAHRNLLMDLHMVSAIHIAVAYELNLKVGPHIHFVDALHFYKKFENDIKNQIKLFDNLVSWKPYAKKH